MGRAMHVIYIANVCSDLTCKILVDPDSTLSQANYSLSANLILRASVSEVPSIAQTKIQS